VVLPALTAALEGLAGAGTERLLLTAERGGTVQQLVTVLEILEAGPLPVVLAARPQDGAP